ncbi:MAG: cell division protein FtsZ [Rhodovibrionaceae bacterium]
MGLNLSVPKTEDHLKPRITVIGVGGAGGNAVNNMIQSNLEGVEFLIANTDAQAINGSICEQKIQLGRNITGGLGAGARPEIGRAAAEEAMDEVLAHLEGAHMAFIAAGMGGGTGTGAAPVIARAAREAGILTVGVVTKPFQFEGIHRMRLAEEGINELTEHVDTLIIIPNQNLFRVANEKTTFADAFKMADDVLYSGVRGVTDLMVMPGLINLDFADIRSVMTEMGKAMMGTGEGEGDNRAIAAAEAAISNPLLDDVSMRGARGVLINITGGGDMTLFEVDEAANRIRDEVDPDANIIFGSTFDESLDGTMRVSVVATGIDVDEARQPRPVTLSVVKTETAARPAPEEAPAAKSASPVTAEQEKPIAAEAMKGVDLSSSDLGREDFRGQAFDDALREEAQDSRDGGVDFAPADEDQPEERDTAQAHSAGGSQLPEDGFIAPAPAKAPPRQTAQAQPSEADPFAAADMANAATRSEEETRGRSRNKAYNLFARVTGATKSMQQAPERATEKPAEPEVRREPQREPRLETKREPAAAKPLTAPQPASQPVQASPSAALPSAPAQQASASARESEASAQAEASQPAVTAAMPGPISSGGAATATAASVAVEPAPAQPKAKQAEPARQQNLRGFEDNRSARRIQAEEDELDIPAFLRRQAN